MVTQGKMITRVSDTNFFVYVLKLEDEKYYIGISYDPEKRFSVHKSQGKSSANWCKLYKPVELLETIDTKTKRMKEATYHEDLVHWNT